MSPCTVFFENDSAGPHWLLIPPLPVGGISSSTPPTGFFYTSPGQPRRKATGIDAGGWVRRMTTGQQAFDDILQPGSGKGWSRAFPEVPTVRSGLGLGRGRIFFDSYGPDMDGPITENLESKPFQIPRLHGDRFADHSDRIQQCPH